MGAVFAAAGFAMYWLVNKTLLSKQPVLQQS
jgi:hypothetical protein